MKIRFAAILGMVLILSSAAMPVQAAAAGTIPAADSARTGSAMTEGASYADLAGEFRSLGNGWHYRSGAWYYVRGGKAVTGWLKSGGTWYYLGTDGKMKTGWVKDDNKWYRLGTNGAMKTGWVNVSNTWYYLGTNGAMKTGWAKVGGKWYYLDSTGAMKTGWLKIKGLWYYMASEGHMKTGWVKDNNSLYYLTAAGAMKTGWLKTGGKTYYLTGSGAAQTGWLTLSGKKYYFDNNGVLDEEKTQDVSAAAAESTKTETVKTKGEMVAAYALQFVGNPYVYGGNSLTKGTDCSGFVMLVYRNFGVSLPHYDAAIRTKGKSVASLAEAKAGDIICYYGHVAIYLGDGRIVHASNSRDGIKISERADYRTIAGIRRIFD